MRGSEDGQCIGQSGQTLCMQKAVTGLGGHRRCPTRTASGVRVQSEGPRSGQ